MTYTPTAPPESSGTPNSPHRERREAEAYMGKCTTHVTHVALFILGFSALVFGLWKEREIGKLKEKLDELEDRLDLAQMNELSRNLEITPTSSYRRYNTIASEIEDESESIEDRIRRYEIEESRDANPFHTTVLMKRKKRNVPLHVVHARQGRRNGRRIGMLRRILGRTAGINQNKRHPAAVKEDRKSRTNNRQVDRQLHSVNAPKPDNHRRSEDLQQSENHSQSDKHHHLEKHPEPKKDPQPVKPTQSVKEHKAYQDMFPSFKPLMPPAEAVTGDDLKTVTSKLNPKNAMKFSFETMKNAQKNNLLRKKKHHHHSKHKHKPHTNKYTLDPLNLFGYQHAVIAAHYEAVNNINSSADNVIRHWKQADWMSPNSAFVMNDGIISVMKPALYFLYSQIQLSNDTVMHDGINIEVNNRTVASCSVTPARSSNSCFTATTRFISKGDEVYVQQFKDSPLSEMAASTFLGLVHLGVPNSGS